MRFDPIQNDFSSGEISPLLFSRVDLDKVKAGCREMENWYPKPHGPAVKRAGTKYIARAKYHDSETRLIPFSVSATENFVLEFGDLYIRVYTEQGQLITTTELITNGTMELASNWTDVGTPTASGRTDTQAHGGTYSWYFTVDAAGEGITGDVYTTSGIKGYTGGVWVYSDQDKIEVAIRKGDDSGWLSETEYGLTVGMWNYIPLYYNESAAGASGRVEFRSPTGYTSGTWYIDDCTLKEIYEITTTYDADEVFDIGFTQSSDVLYLAHADHAPAKLVRTATYTWTLSSISFTATPTEWGANDYPQKAVIMEQRLIWLNSPSYPQTLWASVSGDYEDQTTGSSASDAFVYTLASRKSVDIFWMTPGEILTIGTSSAEFKFSSNSLGEAITPTNVSVKPQTAYGSANVPGNGIRIGNDIIFLQKGMKKFRKFKFNFESNSYVAEDITILNEHITGGAGVSIVEMTSVNEPDTIIWAARSDGTLIGVTYEPALQLAGWFRCVIAGTDVDVQSVAAIDSATNPEQDDLYILVERTINSSTVKYIEVLQGSLPSNGDQEDAFYVDCGLSYDEASAQTVFQNLNHLEGETLSILADGGTIADETVSDGKITLDRSAQVVHAGLGYAATLRTVSPEGGNPIGSGLGRTKRISKVLIDVYRTLGLKVGVDDDYDTVYFGPNEMDSPPPLFSGVVELPFKNGYDTLAEVELYHDQPLPATIRAIMPEVRTK